MPKFNPFRPNSIVTPGMFHGRIDEISCVAQSLFQTKHGNPQHFLIEGERGIGKSSLFFIVEKQASGQIPIEANIYVNFLVVNIELNTSHTYIDIIKTIAADLKRAISEREKVKELAKTAWDFLTNWEILGVKYQKPGTSNLQPYELLNDLTNGLEQTVKSASSEIDGILILIDEADKPSEDALLGEFVKLLTERLTKRGCDKIILGLAGLPTLISKLRASHESAPRVFTALSLKPLETSERAAVIISALDEAEKKNGFRTEITEEAKNFISQLSEGYPHFIQQFGYCAFEEDTNNIIDDEDVIKGAFKENGALQQLGHKYFNELYFDQIGSDDYRKVLQGMAEHLDSWVDRDKIKSSIKIKDHTLNNALQALKKRNIILTNPAQKGEYRLPTKSFAVWIKALSALSEKQQKLL